MVMRRCALAAWVVGLACGVGLGHFRPPRPMDVDRLIRNIESYREEHPKEAEAYYLLGRVNYLAMASKTGKIGVTRPGNGKEELPTIASDDRQAGALGDGPLPPLETLARYARDSIENFRKAIAMEEGKALYHLGLGSVQESMPGDVAIALGGFPPGEEGAKVAVTEEARKAAEAQLAKLDDPGADVRMGAVAALRSQGAVGLKVAMEHQADWTPEARSAVGRLAEGYWKDAATRSYAAAFHRASAEDLQTENKPLVGLQSLVSYEAATRYLAILAEREKTKNEEAVVKEMRDAVAKLEGKPESGVITPVIVSMEAEMRTLASMEDRDAKVRFDLDGTERGWAWSWVRPNAGILVWDPEHTGEITDGRQLFGNVTFGMIFRDGYQAMESLDDNRDGYLRGAELKGLAVWFDRNGDGVSQPGEVVPVEELGIRSLATHPDGKDGTTLTNAAGVELRNGEVRPTWDWVARRAASVR